VEIVTGGAAAGIDTAIMGVGADAAAGALLNTAIARKILRRWPSEATLSSAISNFESYQAA
jgi:hypothetical protein